MQRNCRETAGLISKQRPCTETYREKCTETAGLISKQEQLLLQEFYVYCQPVDLYIVIANRQRRNPTFLNRTLCYHREAVRSPESLQQDAVRLRLAVSSGGSAPLSLLAALCYRTAAQEFVPVSCTLAHVPPNENGVQPSAGAEPAAEIDLGLPAPLDGPSCAHDLALLLLASEAHPDLRLVKPRHGTRLTSRLTPRLAFGLLPAEQVVSWGYVRVSGQALASQQLTSLGSVQLQRGVLQVRDSLAPTSGAATACCVFSAPPTPLHSVQCTFQIQVARGEAPPVPMQTADRQCRVFYQYFYHNGERHVVEKVAGHSCSFCEMPCRSFKGLRQHLEATHGLFLFGFSADHPDVVPTVNVDVAPDVYNSRGDFTQLDVDAYRQPANKEFYYACPRRQRALRLAQYDPQAAANAAVAGQAAAAMQQQQQQRAVPAVFRTALREPVERPPTHVDSIDDSTASEVQTGDSVLAPPQPAPRRKGRMQQQLATAALRPEARCFHSRSCTPMTREEAAAAADSDDEPDTDVWRRRAREQLLDKSELSRTEKEFVLNWNATTHQKPIHGDLYLPGRVEAFAREHATVISTNPELRRTFINFCIILWDYCILSSEAVDAASKIVAAAPAAAPPAAPST